MAIDDRNNGTCTDWVRECLRDLNYFELNFWHFIGFLVFFKAFLIQVLFYVKFGLYAGLVSFLCNLNAFLVFWYCVKSKHLQWKQYICVKNENDYLRRCINEYKSYLDHHSS
jgi:hypothetical protein